jgi:peptide/nickel transport system permease protein
MAAPAVKTVLSAKEVLVEAAKTKAGIVGFGMLFVLIGTAAVIPAIAPFDVPTEWRSSSRWLDNPELAAPEWVDAFTPGDMARTLILDPADFVKSKGCNPEGTFCTLTIGRTFSWTYDQFPSELQIRLLALWEQDTSPPQVQVTWTRPDGLQLDLRTLFPRLRLPDVDSISIGRGGEGRDIQIRDTIRQWALEQGAEDQPASQIQVWKVLFAKAGSQMMSVQAAEVLKTDSQNKYEIQIKVFAFSEADDVDLKLVVFGRVFGVWGTDSDRRDLLVGLLWGAPVALMFGIVAAGITVFVQVVLGALAAFYGGRWDEIIQRGTDFLIILPLLPVLILVGALYRITIWQVLIIVIIFSLLGASTYVTRSIVLSVKEDLYIEAARSYGASRGRILFRYILPRTLPYTFALLALAVPSFIFLEAALAFLGLSDPTLPTWGKVLGDAQRANALIYGYWWWLISPTLGILFVTVGFAFLGYAFDKILNPRLREE